MTPLLKTDSHVTSSMTSQIMSSDDESPRTVLEHRTTKRSGHVFPRPIGSVGDYNATDDVNYAPGEGGHQGEPGVHVTRDWTIHNVVPHSSVGLRHVKHIEWNNDSEEDSSQHSHSFINKYTDELGQSNFVSSPFLSQHSNNAYVVIMHYRVVALVVVILTTSNVLLIIF